MDEIIGKPVSVIREVKIEQQDPMMDERYRNYMENLEGEDRERFHQRYMRRFQYMAEQNKKRTVKEKFDEILYLCDMMWDFKDCEACQMHAVYPGHWRRARSIYQIDERILFF